MLFGQGTQRHAGTACAAVPDGVQQGGAGGRLGRTGADVAALRAQALAVFEPAQFFHRRYRDVRVAADRDGTAGIKKLAQREQAIAEVGFGGRAQCDGGATGGDAGDFAFIQMGGVHQTPARIDRCMVEQPLHRSRAACGQALLDFGGLLGDVDVDRGRVVADGLHQLGQGGFGHGAQAVQRDADAQHRAFLLPQRGKQ